MSNLKIKMLNILIICIEKIVKWRSSSRKSLNSKLQKECDVIPKQQTAEKGNDIYPLW